MKSFLPRFAISLLLTSIAQSAIFWTDDEPSNHLWTDSANWNTGALPTSADEVQFNTANTSAEITPGMVAETGNFILGRHALNTSLTVTGGTLTTGGTLFMIGQYFDASGTMTVSGGTITINSEFSVGSGGPGTLTITNGDITVNGALRIGRNPNEEAVGLLELKGGSISATSLAMNDLSSMTVEPGGSLLIDGNAVPTVQGLIDDGQITSSETIQLDYDISNPGKTTLWANVPTPPSENETRDIGTAGPAYTHPRLFFSAADKPQILARRISSPYYTAIAQPRTQNAVNSVNGTAFDALANTDLSSPDWPLIEATFNGNEGRNQPLGTLPHC